MTDFTYLAELQGVCQKAFARLGDSASSAMMSAALRNGYPSPPSVRERAPDPVVPQAQSSEAFLADYATARSAAIAGVGATAEATKASMRALLGSEGDAGNGTPSLEANMRRQLGQPS